MNITMDLPAPHEDNEVVEINNAAISAHKNQTTLTESTALVVIYHTKAESSRISELFDNILSIWY